MASIQGIYLAFFGRPADPLGLAYWEEQTNGGADLSVMLNALSGTEEYQARFVNMSNAEVIESIYQALFGREPEAEGLAHFLEALANGTQTLGSIAVNILDGAQGTDLAIIENKIAAAEAFTASLDTPEEIAAYSGDAAADFGRAFINQVTEDPATVPTAEEVQEQINSDLPDYDPDEAPAPGGGGGGTPAPSEPTTPQTLTLSTGVDNLAGGTSDDTFNATLPGSLNTKDVLRGSVGKDVLNISGGAYEALAAPTLNGIETINNQSNVKLSLKNATGLETVNALIGQMPSGTSQSYVDASINTTFNLVGAQGENTLSVRFRDLTAASDTIKIGIEGSDGGVLALRYAEDNGAPENVDVSLQQAGTNVMLNINNHSDVITVHGAGNIYYNTNGSGEKTFNKFDASGLDGNVVIARTGDRLAVAFTQATEVVTGTGNDWMDFSASSGALKINTGAGNDIIKAGAGNDIIKAGAGNDSVRGGAGNDAITLTVDDARDTIIFEETASANGNDTIANFLGGDAATSDQLDFTAFVGEGAAVSFVDDADADGTTNFNTADSQIIVLENAADRANLAWVANQTAVLIEDANVFYVTTNSLAEATFTQVATLTGVVGFADLHDANFVV